LAARERTFAMKPRHEKNDDSPRSTHLKNPRRQRSCETNLSNELKPGEKDLPHDPQGACAPETTVQGSE